jgi:hypothetical protein
MQKKRDEEKQTAYILPRYRRTLMVFSSCRLLLRVIVCQEVLAIMQLIPSAPLHVFSYLNLLSNAQSHTHNIIIIFCKYFLVPKRQAPHPSQPLSLQIQQFSA